MFIKHGDGKIVTVIKEDELTEQQKKSVDDSVTIKKINEETDTSIEKKSGR